MYRPYIMGPLLGLALGAVTTAAPAVPYTFTNIADTSGPFEFFDPFAGRPIPSINNNGTVAFTAELDIGGSGIFTSNGGPVNTIVDTTFPFRFFSAPSLNNQGNVAFHAERTAGEGIFIGISAFNTIVIADTDSGRFSSFLSFLTRSVTVSINDATTVAFPATLATGVEGIFTGRGSDRLITSIADTRGPFSSFSASFGADPSINNEGTVAFPALLDTGVQGIFTGNGGSTTTIADTTGPFSFLVAPSINDRGTVAFFAVHNTGGRGIFTGSGGPITTVVDERGPFSFIGPPSLNDLGTVAFFADLDAGGFGIFTGPDPVDDKVIGSSDSLFGSSVTDLFVSRGLNDNGQIAFFYHLADGRAGIARADPALLPVPEPGSLVLFAVGLIGLIGLGRSRHRRAEPSPRTLSGRSKAFSRSRVSGDSRS